MKDGVKLLEKFIKSKKISPKLIRDINNNKDIPLYIKNKINRFYKKIGGGPSISTNIGQIDTNTTLGCGTFGCVYTISPDSPNSPKGSGDIIIKKFTINNNDDCDKFRYIINNINILIQNKYEFVNSCTTFKAINNSITYVNKCSIGYFIQKCLGDLNNNPILLNDINNIKYITRIIQSMNKIGIIHGDIKFDNIMQGCRDIRLHDFDGVFIHNNLKPINGLYYNDQMFINMISILYMSPIYYHYRMLLFMKRDRDIDIDIDYICTDLNDNKLSQLSISRYRYFNPRGGMDQTTLEIINKIDDYLINIVSDIVYRTSNSNNINYSNNSKILSELNKVKVMSKKPKDILYNYYYYFNTVTYNLIAYSDIYSWGISLLEFCINNKHNKNIDMIEENAKLILHNYFRGMPEDTWGGM